MNEARLYSKYNGLQRNDAVYILKKYLHLIKWKIDGHENILDIGCGDGNVTLDLLFPLLPISVEKITGADISSEMVEFAKAHNSNSKVFYMQLDISAKELDIDLEEEYDHIFSFYCFHWIQEQRQCAINLFKLLKPGGDILIIFLAKNPIFQVYESLSKYRKWAEYTKNVKKYISPFQNSEEPARDYRNILIKAGFVVHVCKTVDRSYTFKDFLVWKKSVMAVNPFLPKIPDDLKEEYVNNFCDEVRKLNCFISNNNNNDEESVRVQYKLFIVNATKPL